ncbi:MAG: hypothetical protein RLY16_2918 [Bacteroidota bacterium]|jgi:NADP-dependent 3-hydroxy acid dehydrogenase YdfG
MSKIVLITGATSGIGEACAYKYAAAGYHIIITGRREERLKVLATKLSANYGIEVLPLVFDVQNKQAVNEILGGISENWKAVDILINNAGLAAGRDFFDEASMDDWETMMQTNVNGLLYVSKLVTGWMIANGKGHVVNMGSIAGKEVYEKGNVYCASKFAVDAISKSMRIDLLRHGIKVTAIHPGAVETEFALVRFKGNEDLAAATYKGLKPLTGADIADTIFYCTQLPAHVCINDLVITCTQQGGAYYFYKQ